MIGLVHHPKIYAYTQPPNMRKGFDGLLGIVANLLAEDPLSGHFFLFQGFRPIAVRIFEVIRYPIFIIFSFHVAR